MFRSEFCTSCVAQEIGWWVHMGEIQAPLMFGMSQCCDPWEKPEITRSPLKIWSWHSIQRVKQWVTQTAGGSAAEHGWTRWELCALRSSSAKSVVFVVDNTDGQVHTLEGKNVFHATAMTVYQIQHTIYDRTYLTEAQHPESHLPSLSMARLLCMNLVFTKVTLNICQRLSAFFIRAILTANLSATARHTYS